MLLNLFLNEKKCYDNFFIFLRKKLKRNFLLLYMATFSNNLDAKLCENFYCSICDYGTSRKSSYEKHCESMKHKNREKSTNSNILVAKLCEKKISCEKCEKKFKDRSGLWRHKKKCLNNDEMIIDGINIEDKDALVIHLLKQNGELQNKLIELSMEKSITNNNNNCHNTTNNAFNMNFFLNETCKNAMNITDFANSIKLQLSDLISVGELGYVEGISNIIVKNLNALDITERPVHCTDKKRETIYIKDEDKWEKDEDDKKLKKFIKTIAFKNQKLFPQFKEKYPDYNDYDSKRSDQYSKIVIESLNDSNPENEEKIIKKISKATTIDKIKNN